MPKFRITYIESFAEKKPARLQAVPARSGQQGHARTSMSATNAPQMPYKRPSGSASRGRLRFKVCAKAERGVNSSHRTPLSLRSAFTAHRGRSLRRALCVRFDLRSSHGLNLAAGLGLRTAALNLPASLRFPRELGHPVARRYSSANARLIRSGLWASAADLKHLDAAVAHGARDARLDASDGHHLRL